MKDVEPKVSHFRFVSSPENIQAGTVFTPFMGEVEVGRIYEATEPQAAVIRGHQDWEESSQEEFATQDEVVPEPRVTKPRAPQAKAKVSFGTGGDVPTQGETDGEK